VRDSLRGPLNSNHAGDAGYDATAETSTSAVARVDT
jgi:hypothetical protein